MELEGSYRYSTTLKIATRFAYVNNTVIVKVLKTSLAVQYHFELSNVKPFLLLHGKAQNGNAGHRLDVNFYKVEVFYLT